MCTNIGSTYCFRNEKYEATPPCTYVSLNGNEVQMNMHYATFKFKWQREKTSRCLKMWIPNHVIHHSGGRHSSLAVNHSPMK